MCFMGAMDCTGFMGMYCTEPMSSKGSMGFMSSMGSIGSMVSMNSISYMAL